MPLDDVEGVYCWFFILGTYQHVAVVAAGGIGCLEDQVRGHDDYTFIPSTEDDQGHTMSSDLL